MTHDDTTRSPRNAAERAYHHLKDRILSGELDGALLSENQVAVELGTSRTPVREAFLRLQAEGFMRLYAKRGALVIPPGPHENRELLQARLVIERGVIPLAVERADELVPGLRQTVADQTAAARERDVSRFTALDVQFHHAIVLASGNSILIDFHRSLRDRHMRIAAGTAMASTELVADIERHHTEIIDALAARDVELATRLSSDHLLEIYREAF